MRYLPHTQSEITAMLQTVGVSSVDDLFASIPAPLLLRRPLSLPPALSEWELKKMLAEIAQANSLACYSKTFMGGGAYPHFVPAAVDQIANRGEFLTAYTPYQPEVSQGTLQAIFEYQTMVCELLGMEVANASHYDLATGCAEALLMAHRINGRRRALIAGAVNPQYRQVIATYVRRFGFTIETIPTDAQGLTDLTAMSRRVSTDGLAAILMQTPNYFGCLEDLKKIRSLVQDDQVILISATAEPLMWALLEPPGQIGFDIALCEGQSLGLGLNSGGPYLGLFATREKFVRAMPGRLVGQTVDVHGRRGYVLTLATREQHIRREKATSNICTNQGLCALKAAIYLALMGREGLVELARQNLDRAHYLRTELMACEDLELPFAAPFFNEFVLRPRRITAQELQDFLAHQGMLVGPVLELPQGKPGLLICATEVHKRNKLDALVHAIRTGLRAAHAG